MEQHRSQYRIAKMAQWLQVSKSGYYAWRKRSKNRRYTENESLLKEIIRIHEESRGTYGTRKITHEINRKSEKPVNHKRIERIMRENGIRSKSHRKYKATTNFGHNLPVAENILNRNFTADRPGQKMVSDITYIPTDEGWLYLAGVMDLCGDKIVGISMDGRMTKPEWAEAFIAVRIDGMSIRQHAAQVGDSENNITQKLNRAANKLKKLYQNRKI